MLSDSTYTDDFLWFGIYRIKKTEAEADKELAIDHCIRSAYKDSCRHIKYRLTTSQIEHLKNRDASKEDKEKAQAFEDAKDAFIDACVEIIKVNILSGLINNTDSIDFDDWHKTLCKESLGFAPDAVFGTDGEGLTIGQRQKWVNMSIKNMLIMGLWDEALKPYMESIHVPIDSNIIKAAKASDGDGLGIRMNIPEWNKICDYENEYLAFQKCIREKCKEKGKYSIEWEWYAWMNHYENSIN